MKKLRIGISIPLILIAVFLIYALIACIPYAKQGSVSPNTEQSFDASQFYSDTVGPERALVLSDNQEALVERLRLISHAKKRIVLSTFAFQADNSGKLMLSALYAAADRGVDVDIIIDAFSYLITRSNKEFFQALGTHENVTIKVYNSVNLLTPQKLNARLHDKYLLIDDYAYILGGRNTFDYFLGEDTSYKNYDWDVLVYSEEKHSPSLTELYDYFNRIWNMKESKVVSSSIGFTQKKKVADAREQLISLYKTIVTEHPDWVQPIDYHEITVPTNRIRIMTNPIDTTVKEPTLFYAITELMQDSKGDIMIHSPYILCNDYMLEQLRKLCSNRTVYLMTNSIANNGNPFGAADYKLNKSKLLDTGLRILEYDKGVSYHGKCFTIGNRLSAVGSFNWDLRSTYINTEILVLVDGIEFNEMLRRDMELYEQTSLAVNPDGTYQLKPGQVPRTISKKREFKMKLILPFDRLVRFLM